MLSTSLNCGEATYGHFHINLCKNRMQASVHSTKHTLPACILVVLNQALMHQTLWCSYCDRLGSTWPGTSRGLRRMCQGHCNQCMSRWAMHGGSRCCTYGQRLCLRWWTGLSLMFYVTRPGTSSCNALSKKILDLSRAKSVIDPSSIQTSEVKKEQGL